MAGRIVQIPCRDTRSFSGSDMRDLFRVSRSKEVGIFIHRFMQLNQKILDFLEIVPDFHGIETRNPDDKNDTLLTINSSKYIGAVPLRNPSNGLPTFDLQVIPQYFHADAEGEEHNANQAYSELTRIINVLEHSISPEYLETTRLVSPNLLKPPAFYEAARFLTCFTNACKKPWKKFSVYEQTLSHPSAGTKWDEYARQSYDPSTALIYPTRSSVLSTNHQEWRELKHVFNMARDTILAPATPSSIRLQMSDAIQTTERKIRHISPLEPRSPFVVHVSDPKQIRELKEHANTFLWGVSKNVFAWRFDMSELFERFVQFVFAAAVKKHGGQALCNHKISGSGTIPEWGLRYLEPDVKLLIGDHAIMVDAKYKRHFLSLNKTDDEKLKKAHRADLHQIISYSSFEPQTNKVGLLVYPVYSNPNSTNDMDLIPHRSVTYVDNTQLPSMCQIYYCGIPFSASKLSNTIDQVAMLIKKILGTFSE